MANQTFIVTLQISPPFDKHFPKVRAKHMASLIRDGVQAKSVSFMGVVPFNIRAMQGGETESASGEMREYSPEDFPEVEEAVERKE